MHALALTGCLLTALGLALFIAGEARSRRAWIWLGKPAASLGFLVAAVGSGALDTPFGQGVLAALVLSLVGDVLLIPTDPRAFLGGLGSFLLGHVAFAVAFFLRGVDLAWAAGAALAIVPVALAVGRWLLPHVASPMKVPVLAYMSVISIMVASAVGAGAAGRPDAAALPGFDWALPAAATMFFVSDLSVARDRFVAPGLDNRLWGLPLYYGAQIWFALQCAAPAGH